MGPHVVRPSAPAVLLAPSGPIPEAAIVFTFGRDTDAVEAFQRAKDGGQLPAAFTNFVDQRLAQLKR